MYIPLTFEGALQKCIIASSSTAIYGSFISGGAQYEYFAFTASAGTGSNPTQQFEVFAGTIDAQVLVVGGGGGGAWKTGGGAGGGGGAQVLYYPNQTLYKGVYSINVGRGGAGGVNTGVQPQGQRGQSTGITGSNFTYVAIGGNGATGSTGATSGDGYVGGIGQDVGAAEAGGGGGGSRGYGVSVSPSSPSVAGNGGDGFTIYIANYLDGYGCGGGGGASSTSNGYSCNGLFGGGGRGTSGTGDSGAPNRGGGGGGGAISGGDGGSGTIIIQYKVNNYCKTYFNQTGSCGCAQITFDSTDQFNYYPFASGSYMYFPCGGTQFVSGTLNAYYPETYCAASNSYYVYSASYGLRQGFVDSTLSQCISKSFTETCTPEAFVATCTSSMVTIYTPSASVSYVNTFNFVAKNATTHSTYSATADRVNYFCISTGSLNATGLPYYPQIISGNFATMYNTASCNSYDVTASWAGVATGAGSITYRYYQCGSTPTTFTFTRPSNDFTGSQFINFCRDISAPFTSTSSGTRQPSSVTFNLSGSCISPVFNTTTCGCP